MFIFDLLKRNLAHYWRTNLAVIAGVGVAVAVLSGALLVGASVRGSLRDILLERLGQTEYVVTGQNFFRAQLAEDIQATQQFNAAPLIALTGTLESDQSKRRGADVLVYGVDERFWRFHATNFAPPQGREILLSEALAQELQPQAGETLLLRVEKPSAIPVESLHGRKDDLGKSLRLDFRGVVPVAQMGDFSLRPTQASVRAVFVPLALLQKELEQTGGANTLLVAERVAGSAQQAAGSLNTLLKDKITLGDLGVNLRPLAEYRSFVLHSESGLLSDYLFEITQKTARQKMYDTEPIFSYLANAIRYNGREVPYSLVSTVGGGGFDDKTDRPENSIYFDSWAAKELNAPVGATVQLDYYLWQDDGQLATKTEEFIVRGLMPPAETPTDKNIVPDYPGLTESESISEWNPPFPVDLNKIRPQDEAYWKQFRTKPKAYISLPTAQALWSSRFGKFTAVMMTPPSISSLSAEGNRIEFAERLTKNLNPTALGLAVLPVKADGLQAARGTTDFGEYFLYFSFFLVVSALLLAALFFRFGIEQRVREIGLLQAVGFSAAAIRGLFLREGLLLATAGSLLGTLGAILYGKLIVFGLNNWWSGAVGTSKLSLAVSPLALGIGLVAGILAALACVALTLRGLARQSARSLLAGSSGQWAVGREKSRRGLAGPLALVFGLLGAGLLIAATVKLVGLAAGFFVGGATLLVAALLAQSAWLKRDGHKTIAGHGAWPLLLMGIRNATHRPGRSVLCITLIAAAAFIVVTVDSFRKDGKQDIYDRKAGNGGFPLLAEAQLPLLHNPNTKEGREELNLSETPQAGFTRFRVRPGDDASCLNLFQAGNPRIIAPADDFLNSNRFTFSSTLTPADNPWKLLEQDQADGATPVIADANSLAYALHLVVGDVFTLPRANGEAVRLRVVGALSDSIFQGEFVMAEKNFLRLFPEQQGFRFFLLDAPPETAGIWEEKLADYGFDARPANERLAEFHRVENTYLSTFQMLGALGLALGTLGLGAILLRNTLERRRELALLKALGYGPRHFALMSLAENGFLLFGGLLTGTICALLAVVPVTLARGGGVPFKSVLGLLALVTLCGLGASWLATRITLRAPLLQALRSE